MPNFGSLQIDDQILNAIRDNRLVIFAGAGVSMGDPANLPNFSDFAVKIAVGTSLAREVDEPTDRFLGRLEHSQVKVHPVGAQLLSDSASKPTALHMNLMRLFGKPESVRLVTTNFDLLFEAAAKTVFERSPDIYRAPALPRGQDFRGLVHIHGDINCPREMVLTDADFGRGYITEGWAQRFLVDVFKNNTVLFVGYSHNDVVMHYLARALPPNKDVSRYALSEGEGSWKLLGITPILFGKGTDGNNFQELYGGVQCLAERVTRGILVWQSRLTQIGSQTPPIDDETIGEIEQALREVHTTRFLTDVVRRPEWPTWLDTRKHLDKLFDNATLTERDQLLARWLAKHYAIDHADELIQIIAARKMRLNPDFWHALGREVGINDEEMPDNSTLSRWISILLANVPTHPNYCYVLAMVAARCAKQNNVKIALEAFLFMGGHSLTVKPGVDWSTDGQENKCKTILFEVETPLWGNIHGLKQLWGDHLKPNLTEIAQPLLSGISRRLEEIHHSLLAWGKAGRDWDRITWRRSAIEAHEQDRYAEPIDVLIDAARDALEWLAINQLASLDAWIERFVVSDVPLLRRLATHAITVHPAISSDKQLDWLIKRVGLHVQAEHHEVYRAVARAYPAASERMRQLVIDAVFQYQFPNAEDPEAVSRTARKHYDWLSWLNQADTTCTLVQEALTPIEKVYPIWKPRAHPDMMYWTSSGSWSLQSPWTVEQLLAKPPTEWLDELLSFQGDHFDGPNRDSLILVIQEACKQQPSWAFQLDAALSAPALWNSDLWSPMLRGLREAELTLDDWKQVFNNIARDELFTSCKYEIAELLNALVEREGKPFALELLDQANTIAHDLWESLSHSDEESTATDWLTKAINHPAGRLVEFWIRSLVLRVHSGSYKEKEFGGYYRDRLTSVIQDESVAGGMGRSVVASQLVFLFGLEEEWTRKYVIPLFSSPDFNKFSQAWDGFLVGGQLYGPLSQALQSGFLAAIQRLNTELAQNRRRFIEYFTGLIVFHVDDPISDFLPALFTHGSLEDQTTFAFQLGFFLRHMPEPIRQNLWDRWLHRYWKNRLHAVPRPLEETELKAMLDWLPYLGELFPQGVSLTLDGPSLHSPIEHGSLFFEIPKSDLITRFPDEMAKLIIYLCPHIPAYHRQSTCTIVQQLLPLLNPDLKHEFTEAMVYCGFMQS